MGRGESEGRGADSLARVVSSCACCWFPRATLAVVPSLIPELFTLQAKLLRSYIRLIVHKQGMNPLGL